jgi:medium-chain acyl-[acyl-carrier-protein] hydrolase
MSSDMEDELNLVPLRWGRGDRPVLICFPHAGGGAAGYRLWPDLLQPFGVCGVELPGRDRRIGETAVACATSLVQRLAAASHRWPRRPFAFFGHSMGALLAFELARELRRRRRPGPMVLVVSSHRAPHVADSHPIGHLPDDEFLSALADLSDWNEQALSDRELRALLLPTLRADVRLCEGYHYVPDVPLDLPIVAFRGRADRYVSEADVRAWSQHTSSAFRFREFDGGHMYPNNAALELAAAVTSTLEQYAALGSSGSTACDGTGRLRH